ncbi:MAG TPA: hypothetical protein VEM95_07050 [Thermoplasmata archaeon]|nr:hypothetical protein [Thermoplasmata archaeon]
MGVEDEFDEVRKMINRMLQDAVQGKTGPEPAGSRAYPSHSHPRDELTPVRRYIVQVPPEPGLPGPDVMEDEDSVFVTLELGGRTPTAVRAQVSGRLLFVEAEGPRALHRVVELPCEVETEVQWTVRGGVLDLALRRRASG